MIKATITIIAIMVMLINANISTAENSWEMSIKAKVLNAENRLIIGQFPGAGDGIDGRYDVPALLAGDIKAYMELEGEKYWKNIKKSCSTPCKKRWNIIVESDALGEIIKLGWNPSDIPYDIRIVLIDTATGKVTNMKRAYRMSYENKGRRKFIVETQTR